jgi:hypothetical protein
VLHDTVDKASASSDKQPAGGARYNALNANPVIMEDPAYRSATVTGWRIPTFHHPACQVCHGQRNWISEWVEDQRSVRLLL